jgi:hypothetical protein
VSGRVNYKKLLEDNPLVISDDDVEKYRSQGDERCRVRVRDSVKHRYIEDEEVLAPLQDLPEEVDSSYF